MKPPAPDSASSSSRGKPRHAPLKLRYSLDLFCWDAPAGSRLIRSLIPNAADEPSYYMTPSRDRYVEQGCISIERFLRTMESYREDVLQCSETRFSIAFYPECLPAECTLRVPSSCLRRLAACGAGLEVAVYPYGNGQTRNVGTHAFVVAEEGRDAEKRVNLLPNIRRYLNARGLTAIASVDYDLSFADVNEFLRSCLPKKKEKPGLLSLNKFLEKFAWPSFVLDSPIIKRLAGNGDDLELHFNFPQRRARKVTLGVSEQA